MRLKWTRRGWAALRRLDLADWIIITLAVFIGGLGIGMTIDGVGRIADYPSRITGTMAIEDCDWRDSRRGGSWSCSGTFISNDGTVQIDSLPLRQAFSDWPAEPVTAWVGEPSADQALPSGAHWLPLPGGLVMLGVAIWLGHSTIKDRDLAGSSHGRHATSVSNHTSRYGVHSSLPASPQEPVPRNPTVVRVLAWYLAFLVGTTGLILLTAEWNRGEQARHSDFITVKVVATHLGASNRIDVEWRDPAGYDREMRLTPIDADALKVGDRVELLRDPDDPDDVRPANLDAFDWDGTAARVVWVIGLVLTGVVVALLWTWLLVRWMLGRGAPSASVTLSFLVSIPYRNSKLIGPQALWIELTDPTTAGVRLQRIVWGRSLAAIAMEDARVPAIARKCPGLSRMYIVDISGVGRCWPAGRARTVEPTYAFLKVLEPGSMGRRSAMGYLTGGLGIAVVAAMVASFAGVAASGYVVLMYVASWHCWGAIPIRGVAHV